MHGSVLVKRDSTSRQSKMKNLSIEATRSRRNDILVHLRRALALLHRVSHVELWELVLLVFLPLSPRSNAFVRSPPKIPTV